MQRCALSSIKPEEKSYIDFFLIFRTLKDVPKVTEKSISVLDMGELLGVIASQINNIEKIIKKHPPPKKKNKNPLYEVAAAFIH